MRLCRWGIQMGYRGFRNQLKFKKGCTRATHPCVERSHDLRLVWPFVRL